VQISFEYCFVSFIQTDLPEAVLDFLWTIIRRLHHALYSDA
jgi:hypothetical protein